MIRFGTTPLDLRALGPGQGAALRWDLWGQRCMGWDHFGQPGASGDHPATGAPDPAPVVACPGFEEPAVDPASVPRLVLRVRRGGKLLASWSLGAEPLEISVVDLRSGEEVGNFTARGSARLDPAELGELAKVDDDDFTMPLPEPTEPTDGRLPTEERPRPEERSRPEQRSNPRPVPNLARVAQEGDDLTLPDPEATGAFLPLKGGPRPVKSAQRPSTMLPDPAASHNNLPRPRPQPNTTAAFLHPIDPDDGLEEISLHADTEEAPPELKAPPAPAPSPTPSPSPDAQWEVRPAEIWMRRREEWQASGHLQPGQRVPCAGGWIKLNHDGRLVVCPGPTLSGSATLLDGRTVDLHSTSDQVLVPSGASVLLRAGEQGIYVRSEPAVERSRSAPRAPDHRRR